MVDIGIGKEKDLPEAGLLCCLEHYGKDFRYCWSVKYS